MRLNASASRAGPPASVMSASAAALTQSVNRAGTEPWGLSVSASFWVVVSRLATSLAGDFTASRTRRLVPARMERGADVDGRAGVDERGVGLDLPVGEDFRERPEVPGCDAGLGQLGRAGR